jgi:hypothetical protein
MVRRVARRANVKPGVHIPRSRGERPLDMRRILLPLTAAVLNEWVEAPAKRIEEASFVRIGGIEQWVTIRGDDDRKPVLLPYTRARAMFTRLFLTTDAPCESDFVLVQWDQRGAGRTFAKDGLAGVTRETLI